MNIKHKLIAAFGVMILITAVATGAGWWISGQAADRTASIASTDIPLLKKINRIFGELKNARLEEKRFLMTKDLAAVDLANQHLTEARTLLGQIHAKTSGEDLRRQSKAAITLIDKYRNNLTTAVDLWTQRGLTHKEGTEGKLRSSVHKVESVVNEYGLAELKVLMLMCRRHEKDYLLRGDAKYLGRITKRIEEFEEQMEMFGLPSDERDNLRGLLKSYYEGVAAIVSIDKDIHGAVTTMNEINAKVEQQADIFKKAAFQSIDQNISKSVSSLSIFIYILIAAVTVGVVLGVYIVRAITRPISRIIATFTESAEQVAAASGQVSSASQSLAGGSSEQAASIEETSSSLEEMSAMTKQNANNANQANTLMIEANQVVSRAHESMSKLTTSMDDISKASEETSKIIKTIDEIAFQTNLLALNVAVEAARAGEAGAGFAVVADEVRNLAMRAADAAKDTSELIEESVKKISEGTEMLNVTNEAFGEVAKSAGQVSELVDEIAAASTEQSQGIDQINTAVTEMDRVTQQNAANAEESASASEEMNAQAEQMRGLVNELRTLVGGQSDEHPQGKSPEDIKEGPGKINKAVPLQTETAPERMDAPGKIRPEKVLPLGDDDFSDF